jgi:hypothetical protein
VLAEGSGGQLGGFASWFEARSARLVRELRIWHPAQLGPVVGVVLGLVALRVRGRGELRAATAILLSALVIELGTLAAGWHRAVDPGRHEPYPVTADMIALQEITGEGRVYIASAYDGAAPFFPPNTLAMYGVNTVQQFETVGYRGIWQRAGHSTDPVVLGSLAVTHAVAPRGMPVEPGWTLERAGATFDIWRNPHAAPLYAGMAATSAPPGNGDAQALVPLTLVQGTMNRRLLQIPPGTATVRVAENWAEGWEYRMGNGGWQAAARAPDGSMLLQVGTRHAGTATLEMRYEPAVRRVGRLVTWWAVLLTIAAACGVALPVRRRRPHLQRRPA